MATNTLLVCIRLLCFNVILLLKMADITVSQSRTTLTPGNEFLAFLRPCMGLFRMPGKSVKMHTW